MSTSKQEAGKNQDQEGGGGQGGGQGGGDEASPIDVQRSLKGIDFPASKEDILAQAKQGGADENVMGELEQIPDREYDSPTDISRELGKLH
ncbi:DUF2795 domain-containing protein [Cupriavidus respiraculi]|uniref:DUF2795 domain-containing protein n=1 Tax=Cupriavidus respiraculi TaxID=195930 RepID=UPI001C9743AD|nr:DUF2795 domain-containing protein [Cupriavidus respiraculi]MBY4948593.1 DUF2795 domain-containing protein [Cupriavidus respiraculi]